MVQRLQAHKFPFHFEHKAFEGGHTEPLKHFDAVLQFLRTYFF
jgi:uncharacterized protein